MKSRSISIEEILEASCAKRMAVSVKVRAKEPVITVVDKIVDRGDLKLVQLNASTLYGEPISETVIHLDDIENVLPLYVSFNDQRYERMREIKQKFLSKE
jgi:hypothetical protein